MNTRIALTLSLLALVIVASATVSAQYDSEELNKPHYDVPRSRLFGAGNHIGEFGGFFLKENATVMNVCITPGNFRPRYSPGSQEKLRRDIPPPRRRQDSRHGSKVLLEPAQGMVQRAKPPHLGKLRN